MTPMTVVNNFLIPTLHMLIDVPAEAATADLPGACTICPGATFPTPIASVGAAGSERTRSGRTYWVASKGVTMGTVFDSICEDALRVDRLSLPSAACSRVA